MSGSKKETVNDSNSTATTTPIVPSFVADPDQAYVGKVAGIMGMDPTQFVAPASANQNTAFAGAQKLGGWQSVLTDAMTQNGVATTKAGSYAPPTIDPTTNATATTIASLLKDHLSDYVNPETDAVVNTTLAGYDKKAGSDQAALDAAGALTKGFGGSGFALGKSNLTNSQELGRASTEAGLRQTAFDKATGLAGQDAGLLTNTSQFNAGQANTRAIDQAGLTQQGMLTAIQEMMTGAGQTAQIGNMQGVNARGDVATQLDAGQAQRSIDGDQRAAPLNFLAALKQLLGYDPTQFIGKTATGTSQSDTTETSTPSTLDTIGKVAGMVQAGLGGGGGSGGFSKLFNSGGGSAAAPADAANGEQLDQVLAMFA